MSEPLVTIARYVDFTEAQIAAGLLESEGIPVHRADIGHRSADWMLGIDIGEIRLQVPASYEQAARTVLASPEALDKAELDRLATSRASARENLRGSLTERKAFRTTLRGLGLSALVPAGVAAVIGRATFVGGSSKRLDVMEGNAFTFTCSTCGEKHVRMPTFGADRPLNYYAVPEKDRASRCDVGSETCCGRPTIASGVKHAAEHS